MLLDEQMCIFLLPNGISDFQISVSTFFSWLDYFKLVKYVYLREFSVIKFNRLQILIQTQIPIQIILALPDKSCHKSKIKKSIISLSRILKKKKELEELLPLQRNNNFISYIFDGGEDKSEKQKNMEFNIILI